MTLEWNAEHFTAGGVVLDTVWTSTGPDGEPLMIGINRRSNQMALWAGLEDLGLHEDLDAAQKAAEGHYALS